MRITLITISLLLSHLILAQNDTIYPSTEYLDPSLFDDTELLVGWEESFCPVKVSGSDTTFAPCYIVTYRDHYNTSIDLCPDNLDSVGGIGLFNGTPRLLDADLFNDMEADGSNIISDDDDYTINYKNLTTGETIGSGSGAKYCIEADLYEGTGSTWYQTFQILTGPVNKPGDPINYHTAETIGLLKNGMILEHTPPSSESTAAMQGGIIPVDYCGWHPEPAGFGHFHAIPNGINVPLAANGIASDYFCVDIDQNDGKGFVGFTFEGIPIYGPYESDGSTPTDLDDCNGHTGTTPDFEGEIYHYHASATDIINNPPCFSYRVPLEDTRFTHGAWTASVPDTPGEISGLTEVCENQTGVTYSIEDVATATSYNWTVPEGASIVSGAGTTSITVDFGTTFGDVCVNAANETGTSGEQCIQVVDANCATVPDTPGEIDGLSEVCQDQAGVTYSISEVTGAETYNWTVPADASIVDGEGTSSITVDWGATIGEVCVNAENSAGVSEDQCLTISEGTCSNVPDQPGNISGLDEICADQTGVEYSISEVTGATSYNWTVPSGATIIEGQGSTIITVDFGSDFGEVCVNAENSAGTSDDQCITIFESTSCDSTPDTPGEISGLTAICEGQSGVEYSIEAVEGADSYNWTVPSDASITSGQGTTTIVVAFGSEVGNVCVNAANSSGTSNDQCVEVVQSSACSTAPQAPGDITGLSVICPNQPGVKYRIAPVESATSYTWSVPPDAEIKSGEGTTRITVDFGSEIGEICVFAENENGMSESVCLQLTEGNCQVTPDAPGNISGLTSICQSQTSVSYSIDAVTGADTYNWTVPTGATIDSGDGTTSISVSFGTDVVGQVCVNASNNAGTSDNSCIDITESTDCGTAPETPGEISGLTEVCSDQSSVTYSIDAVATATSYNWTVPSDASIASGQGTTSITVNFGLESGDVCVNAENSSGSSADNCLDITVEVCGQIPDVPGSISGLSEICPDQSGVTYAIDAVATATTYNWSVPSGATIISGQGTTSITVDFGNQIGSVCVNAENAIGSSEDQCLSIIRASTCESIPDTPGEISGLSEICSGQQGITYSIDPVPGATTYTWTVPSGATITSGQGSTSIEVDFGNVAGSICVSAENSAGTSSDQCLSTELCTPTNANDLVTTSNLLQVFPNPSTSGKITIAGSFDWYRIFDASGALVLDYPVQSRDLETQVDLSKYKSGIYFVNVQKDNVVLFERVLIK